MDDRLRVSVGNNFELEGPQAANSTKANIAGDVALDYMLSRDGRYLLRVYRRNQYDFVVEGQVVETGVSFIFALDFEQYMMIDKTEAEDIEIIAKNIAWMYSGLTVDANEIKTAIRDITLTIDVEHDYIERIYQKYLLLIN
ncbi:MAG: hypothetical protein EOP48_17355 [Sphingobacteriales bacterium]|nr:MAG: hypothetical protein EOP48_17355 [Sphingobacteriales bacterium]